VQEDLDDPAKRKDAVIRPHRRPLRASAPVPLLAACFVLGASAPANVTAQEASEIARWHEGLRNLRPDPTRGTAVRGLTINREAGALLLVEGQLHLLVPIEGRTVGAVFVGEGRFQMVAPDRVEREQLRRVYGVPTLDQPLRSVVLLFSGDAQAELEAAAAASVGAAPLAWGPLEPHGDAAREAAEAREYFTNGDGWIDRAVALPLVNGGSDLFYAHLSEDRARPTIFFVDPLYFEEVGLYRRAERGRQREVVAQFHRRADYAAGASPPQETLDLVRVDAYHITTTIAGDLGMTGRATMTITRLDASYDWVPFHLYSDLDVDSIQWDGGTPVPFYRANETSDVWLDLSGAPDEGARLIFHYSGEMLDRQQGLWVQLATHTTWFPVYEFGREIPYRLTFNVPERFEVTTLGSVVSETTTNGVTTTVWETPPVRLITFNIGEFDEFVTEQADAPKLTVLINEGAHRRLAGMVSDGGSFLLRGDNMTEAVATDLSNSFRFFNRVYGPTAVQDFVATEIPYSHGEAYAGLVMLAWSTFQYSNEKGYDEMFRAHEVAHQWWGIGVRPATYRDRWLAEGFSEFSGWWYAAAARGSIDMYRRRLRETREAIVRRRDDAPPLALGTRVGTSDQPEDYQLTIYLKGAWVLHMLRTILTDPDTGNDDAFTRVMHTFYTTYAGGEATTRDFQRVVEQVVGTDMAWFFDQWVYGSSIPAYRFSYRLADAGDGNVRATVRVVQEGVPESFQMIVPILLDFGAEGSAVVRVPVTGPVTELDLPLLPGEPDRVVFNPDEAVLAETRTEAWRD